MPDPCLGSRSGGLPTRPATLAGEEGVRHSAIGNDGMQYADRGNGGHEQKPRASEVFRDCLEFFDWYPRRGRGRTDRALQAVVEMIVDQRLLGGLDRLLDRLELLGDLQAVAPFFQHPDDAAEMPLRVAKALDDRGVRGMNGVTHDLTLPQGEGYSNFAGEAAVSASPVCPRRPGARRPMQPARDHMNPRSTPQPLESDSRRLPPALTALRGWITARVVHVTVMPFARARQG